MSVETSSMIDSRDLIEELAAYDDALANGEEPVIDQEYAEAIRTLEGEGIDDWEYGATLIHENYFEEYARELAEDIGAIPQDVSWPCSCIDWEWAARELSCDYTMVRFYGSDYYVR